MGLANIEDPFWYRQLFLIIANYSKGIMGVPISD